MTGTDDDDLPEGVYRLYCGSTPVAVTKDPKTMSAKEKDAICNGGFTTFDAMNFDAKHLEVFRDAAGKGRLQKKE